MLLFLGSFEPLRCINNSKVGKAVKAILIVMAVFSGLFTMKNAPWLYVGKVPCLIFRPPTPQEILLGEDLLKLSSARSLSDLRLYQDFDPGVYTVKIIEWGLKKPADISSLNINAQSLLKFSAGDGDVIFNARSLVVTWS